MQTAELRRYVIFLGVLMASVFVPAGTLGWWNGWVFVVVMAAAVASVSFGVFRAAPELAQERRTAVKHAQAWDRAITPLISGLPLVTVVLAGLGHRFAWRPLFPCWSACLAALAMAAGSALAYWAMRTNRFFSSYARIQADREQVVVQAGPYALVRHPGYLGAIMVTLGTPVLLDSLPGMVLAAVVTGLVMVRTTLEDRMLTRELPGYVAYREHTRYRLLPLLW